MQIANAPAESMMVILTTAPSREKGLEIAKILVQENLCACVNLIPSVESVYVWDEKLCRESETLLIMKTGADKLQLLEKRLIEIHPYEVPEFVALNPAAVGEKYLAWVTGQR